MKNKIIVGILVGLISLNIVGCGCGTPKQEETSTSTVAIETESIEVVTETVEDYADSLEEIEGGDGEETTEVIDAEVESTEVTESTEETPQEEEPSLGYTVTECSPVTKYTNTSANIRSIPDKSGELINTVSINTEFTVTATTDNGWSRIESNGLVCFIKSSLLSDTKTKVQTQSSSNSGGGSSSSSSNSGVETQPQAQTPSQPQSQPDISGLPADFFADETPDTGVYGGTTGSVSTGMGGVE